MTVGGRAQLTVLVMAANMNEALSLLLRYPSPSADHGPQSFVYDALDLKNNLATETGHAIIQKRTGRRPPPAIAIAIRQSSPARSDRAHTPFGSPSPASFESLLQNAAREVMSRGERWGLSQAVRDVVG